MKYLLTILLVILSATLMAAPDGEKLYERYCAACHQSKGEGGIGLPLSNIKLSHVSNRYLKNTIRLGRPGRIMPAYPDLSDAQVNAIVSHMRSWSEQAAREFPTDTIVGNRENGKLIYAKRCAKCHADDGSGEGRGTGVTKSRKRQFMIMPAAINNPGYLASVSDAEIREIILADRDDSKMPSMKGKLNDQEVNDLVAYVRSLKPSSSQFTAALTDKKQSASTPLSIVVESPNDFETTLSALRAALTGSNFRLFTERYLEQGIIDEFTHNTRQVGLRFCNFSRLYDMLKVEPRLGVFLPCRITIMEQPDGKVILVAPNMKLMASWFNNDELYRIAESMEESIMGALEEATF